MQNIFLTDPFGHLSESTSKNFSPKFCFYSETSRREFLRIAEFLTKISDLENQSAGKVISITTDQLIPRLTENLLCYYFKNHQEMNNGIKILQLVTINSNAVGLAVAQP